MAREPRPDDLDDGVVRRQQLDAGIEEGKHADAQTHQQNGSQRVAPPRALRISGHRSESAVPRAKKCREPEGSRQLNREASRLGDVRVLRPSFRVWGPGNPLPRTTRGETRANHVRETKNAAPHADAPRSIAGFSVAKTASLETRGFPRFLRARSTCLDTSFWLRPSSEAAPAQAFRASATLRSRKSRNTAMRLELLSSSG